uniref:Reverse transcriptase domain-containing protein n=1 Tax=Sphaeramia orbicularis TaxID=375764 RepID=A0A673AUF8_9TELE
MIPALLHNQVLLFRTHTENKRKNAKRKEEETTTQIVIKSADKGGAIVILDRSAYVNEVQRQLTFKEKIKMKLDHLENNDITKTEYTFMTVEWPVVPVLYNLPKIHQKYTDVPPGRPIVSATGSLTQKISAFVDYFPQPLVTSLPSYRKDSMEFIKMIQTLVVPNECFLVTMDIESLYTNVPFEGGLQATEFFFKSTRRLLTQHRMYCRPNRNSADLKLHV